jgi:hypothetical protein
MWVQLLLAAIEILLGLEITSSDLKLLGVSQIKFYQSKADIRKLLYFFLCLDVPYRDHVAREYWFCPRWQISGFVPS